MGTVARLVARRGMGVLPRRTVRLRLTLVYGAVFLVSGLALLAITYVLVKHDIGNSFSPAMKKGTASFIASTSKRGVTIGNLSIHPFVQKEGAGGVFQSVGGTGAGMTKTTARNVSGNIVVQVPLPRAPNGKAPSHKVVTEQLSILRSEAQAEQNAELRELLFDSGIALVVMAALSILLGWLLAGRALRPLRVITSKAQDISATNLHERVDLRGPDDEMKRVGDTFDALLARLERAFEAQRQFVANASHELRTPLARQRTLLEVAAENPDADVISLREAALKAVAAGEEQEQLIEALLTLASSERGLDDRTPFDLADVARRVVDSKRPEAVLRGLDVDASLSPAPTTGNGRLAERLVGNLVENALRYNEPRGWVSVTSEVEDDHAVLRVVNSGPPVPEADIDRLFEPFQRLESDRLSREGHGLGLSIVRAVAAAHGATVTTTSRPAGGLDVRIAFPLGADREVGRPGDESAAAPSGQVGTARHDEQVIGLSGRRPVG